MASFKDVAFVFILTAMALLLAGCGSSGGDSPAPPPPPAPAAPLELVSQSVEGTLGGSETGINGTVALPSSPFALYIDADKLNVRVEGSAKDTVNKKTGQGEGKAIVNAATKKVTWFLNVSGDGIKPMIGCNTTTIKQMPDAATLKALLDSVLKEQPVTTAADGNKQMVLSVNPSIVSPKAEGTATATVEVEMKSNVLNKTMLNVDLTKPLKVNATGVTTVTKSSAGAPDASKFEVDKTWGTCKEVPPPVLFEDLEFFPLPIKMVFAAMQIKPDTETETEKQSDLIAI